MINFYYFMAIVSYGIFIVQFILSQFAGDIDTDVSDGDVSDFDASSILSPKGFIHLCMGLFGYLSVRFYYNSSITAIDWIIGAVIGFVFVFVLFLIYRLCIKFNHIPKSECGENLVGKVVTIKMIFTDHYQAEVFYSGETHLIDVYEQQHVYRTVGQHAIILSYENGKYYI